MSTEKEIAVCWVYGPDLNPRETVVVPHKEHKPSGRDLWITLHPSGSEETITTRVERVDICERCGVVFEVRKK